jgi:hypothetical protein
MVNWHGLVIAAQLESLVVPLHSELWANIAQLALVKDKRALELSKRPELVRIYITEAAFAIAEL